MFFNHDQNTTTSTYPYATDPATSDLTSVWTSDWRWGKTKVTHDAIPMISLVRRWFVFFYPAKQIISIELWSFSVIVTFWRIPIVAANHLWTVIASCAESTYALTFARTTNNETSGAKICGGHFLFICQIQWIYWNVLRRSDIRCLLSLSVRKIDLTDER